MVEQAEELLGALNIVLNLELQCRGSWELDLVAQPMKVFDLHLVLSNVFGELQQVSLHGHGMLAEGRLASNVRHRTVYCTAENRAGHIDPGAGELFLNGREIQRRSC